MSIKMLLGRPYTINGYDETAKIEEVIKSKNISGEYVASEEGADKYILGSVEFAFGKVLVIKQRYIYDGDYAYEATYWDGEKPVTVVYGSSRDGYYSGGKATVDASHEVKEAYQAYIRTQERQRKAGSLRQTREELKELAAKSGAPYAEILKLWRKNPETFRTYAYLLRTNFRNKFFKSIRDQLIAWLFGPREYDYPLSPRQMSIAAGRAEEVRRGYRSWR